MKSLKNISLLLAFACAVPVYADKQTTATDVATQQTDVVVDAAPVVTSDEQSDVDAQTVIKDAHNLAIAETIGTYGLIASPLMVYGGLKLFDAAPLTPMLLGAAGTFLASLGLMYYFNNNFHNKYKSKLSEKSFKAALVIAYWEWLSYTTPIGLAFTAYMGVKAANLGGWATGAIVGTAAKKIGLSPIAALIGSAGIANAISTYIETSTKADDNKPVSTYQKALDFVSAYTKNLVQYGFITIAGGTAAAMCISK